MFHTLMLDLTQEIQFLQDLQDRCFQKKNDFEIEKERKEF